MDLPLFPAFPTNGANTNCLRSALISQVFLNVSQPLAKTSFLLLGQELEKFEEMRERIGKNTHTKNPATSTVLQTVST